jgi:RNA polymerase sigma-70 factor (ECF subfamily)
MVIGGDNKRLIHTLNEIDVMRRIASRDQHALRELYQEYGKAVYSLAYRILQNVVWAEEVTQDTFLKVWDQASRWDSSRGKLRNWLLTIAHFTAIDRLRKERRQPAVHDDEINEEVSGVITGWQDGSALHMLVRQLPPEQSTLIQLAFFEGMSHSQIAARLSLPLGTVKTRLRSGLQRLRDLWMESNAH